MRVQPHVRALARGVDRRAPALVRRQARRTARKVLRREPPPLVSVVVTASDEDAEYLEECLRSLLEQSHHHLEILFAPHGASAKVGGIVRRAQREDFRIRPLSTSTGRAAARERGAAVASGAYLLFVRGEDLLPARGVERGVRALEASGSDLAVGRLDLARTPHASVLPPYDPAHATDRLATTLADSPVAITDVTLGNRLFRTSFWRAAGLSFPDSGEGEADLALAAYTRGTAFDLLSRPTYVSMSRSRGTPLDQVYDTMADLDDWIADQRTTFGHLADLEDPALRDGWIFGALDRDVMRFVGAVERADARQWALLRDHVRDLVGVMDDAVWERIRAESRVRLWLLLQDRREDLEDLVVGRWFEQDNRPTEVRDGRVLAVLPGLGEPDGPPVDLFEMRAPETPLRTVLRGARWLGSGDLELDLLTYVELVGHEEHPDVEVALVEETTGRRVVAASRPRVDTQANLTVGHAYQDYRLGGLTVTLPVEQAVAASPVPGPEERPRVHWHLELTVTTRGVTRTGTVTSRDERGSAGMLSSGHLARRSVGERAVNLAADVRRGVRLEVSAADAVTLLDARVEGRDVVGTLRTPVRLARVTGRRADGHRVRAAVRGQDDTVKFRLRLPAPGRPGSGRLWQLRAHAPDGSLLPLAWPAELSERAAAADGPGGPWLPGPEGSTLCLSRTGLGRVELLETADTLVLESVTLRPGAVRVTGRWLGVAPRRAVLAMVGQRTSPTAALATAADGTVTADLPTRWDEWGLGETCVPSGQYLLRLTVGAKDRPGRLLASGALVETLGAFTVDQQLRMRAVRTPQGRLGVVLGSPLGEEEWGAYARRTMQDQALGSDLPIDENAVYLQSYAGASATDSQLAIHEELRRTRPELTLYWGVLDHSSRVPEGGVPVVMRSREWYRVLTTSRHLVCNIDLDRWFVKRPGQQLLQTFHGYPAKSMGIRMWAAKNFSPRRIGVELDRTSRHWDLILTPAPEMNEHYRREYDYDGPIHDQGYPRDDVLVSAEAERIRKETRERLGIREGQVAVLYAPTWRDHLATNFRSAKLVSHLDLESASRRLGPEYVLLMRGHRFHARGSGRSERTARLIDVTDYPEINDLILASDTAVLDYSSLRFDYALTGRPMVFLVPDLGDYTGGIRGFLYDYADSAPGPLLDTADQVIERLRDLPGLSAEYADRIAAFNRKYQYLQDGRAAERVVRAFFG